MTEERLNIAVRPIEKAIESFKEFTKNNPDTYSSLNEVETQRSTVCYVIGWLSAYKETLTSIK